MKRFRTSGLLIVAVVLASLSSCKKSQMNVETTIEVPVGVIEVKNSSIEEFVNSTATIYPMHEVTLNSEMAGKYRLQKNPLSGKPYAVGDRVKENTVLINIEDEEYYNNLRLKSKKVELEISKQEYEKQKSLYEKGGATLRELKNSEISLINSEYDIENSRLDLEKMSVKAPFSGVISNLPYFTNGTKVTTNTELVKVINYTQMYLETKLPEKHYGNIEKGMKVYVTSYTNVNDTLMGEITQISPEIDPDARTFSCFVEVDNRKERLLPGMFVKADLVVERSEETVVIPKDIVAVYNRKAIVYVVENGTAIGRQITTGLESDEMIEVITGLEVGESVVSKGFETLRNRSKVRIVK